jgi:hypothetical protein
MAIMLDPIIQEVQFILRLCQLNTPARLFENKPF